MRPISPAVRLAAFFGAYFAANAVNAFMPLWFADRGLVPEIAVGFISGTPTIRDALDTLLARRIIVYPLFVSSGYFTRDRLVQLLDEANRRDREIEVLPPLGLDPGMAAFAFRLSCHASQWL